MTTRSYHHHHQMTVSASHYRKDGQKCEGGKISESMFVWSWVRLFWLSCIPAWRFSQYHHHQITVSASHYHQNGQNCTHIYSFFYQVPIIMDKRMSGPVPTSSTNGSILYRSTIDNKKLPTPSSDDIFGFPLLQGRSYLCLNFLFYLKLPQIDTLLLFLAKYKSFVIFYLNNFPLQIVHMFALTKWNIVFHWSANQK